VTVIITSRAEWERIIAKLQPSPLFVSSDKQWFRNGLGILYEYRG
jgi:hypothetical protein